MHSNNQCEYHNKKIELICINDSCTGFDSVLCENCLKFDLHPECKQSNQIVLQERFIDVMKTALKEKMNDEDVLVLNLKETIDNLQLLYQEVKRDADTRKDKYFTLKQKVKKFFFYKHPKYLQQMKQATSFNEINFNKSKQVIKIEKPILKYVAEIDNSIQLIKQILSKQNNEQKEQQKQSLPLKKSARFLTKMKLMMCSKNPKLNKTKNHRKKTTPSNKDNQQQIVSKNEVDHPQNNYIMQQQTININNSRHHMNQVLILNNKIILLNLIKTQQNKRPVSKVSIYHNNQEVIHKECRLQIFNFQILMCKDIKLIKFKQQYPKIFHQFYLMKKFDQEFKRIVFIGLDMRMTIHYYAPKNIRLSLAILHQ